MTRTCGWRYRHKSCSASHDNGTPMSRRIHIALAPIALLLAAAAPAPDSVLPISASYLHSLSSTSGVLPMDAVMLTYDRQNKEMLVVDGPVVRIFNESGMETYSFGDDPELGGIRAIVALEDGDLLALSYADSKPVLLRCNFRGGLLGRIEPKGVPAEFASDVPGSLRYANGKVYLASHAAMRVVVLDTAGAFVAGYDLAKLIGEEGKRADLGFRGFNVDKDGNLLFTVQPLFQAFVVSPEGNVQAFGVKGSAPGKFNVVSGIARDDDGNIYVADILKSAVIVFDREFRFLREFGYRGRGPQNLAAPEDLAAGNGKLFVSNHARKGVSVFEKIDGEEAGGVSRSQ